MKRSKHYCYEIPWRKVTISKIFCGKARYYNAELICTCKDFVLDKC